MEQKAVKSIVPMPVKATPYTHQIEAFNLAMRLFGVTAGNAGNASQEQNTAYREHERTETGKAKNNGERT